MDKTLTKDTTVTSVIIIENLAELRGQMADILEDALADKGASIPSEDRDMAIEDGEDPEDLAIIYGEDYDVIGDAVDSCIRESATGDRFTPEVIAVTDLTKQNEWVNAVFDAYKELIAKAEFPAGGFTDKELGALKQQIRDTFVAWDLFA